MGGDWLTRSGRAGTPLIRPAGHLLPASGEKGHARWFAGGHGGEGGAARFLRPACGEKVAGRPDEGQAEAMRACELAWDKEAKMEHPFYRCNG